ncbi:MAG: LuxR C-terminal-related transcriptional regulator [Geminicoccaceae bacterium]
MLVVDPRPLSRASMVCLLKQCASDLKIVTLAEIPDDAAALPAAWPRADLVMVSMPLGEHDLDQGKARLRQQIQRVNSLFDAPRIVVLSDVETPELIVDMFRAGASGYIPTSLEPAIAVNALRLVAAGGSYYPENLLARMCAVPPVADGPPRQKTNLSLDCFTERQRQVLENLSHGHSNKVIARNLTMRESTVKVHIRQIANKIGARNRTEIALVGQRLLESDRAAPAG